jgi:anti-anti-sigma factor
MTAFAPTQPTSAAASRESVAATFVHNRLSVSTDWLDTSVVRITASGDIDASNANEFGQYVFRRAANCRRLIIDLHDVEFFATAGFSTLINIHARCEYASVDCTIVSSRAVSRVLQICDPRQILPVATP